MKKAILIAIVGAMTLGVNAGDWGKAPVDKTPIEECYDIGGEISSGYMTDYIFYGVRYARDSVWTDVNYTFDNFVVPITIGAWYLNGISPAGYDELDLYASAALGTYFGFDTSISYTHFFYPETVVGANSYGEIGIDISRSLGFVDFIAEANYAFSGGNPNPANLNNTEGGWYYQAGFEKTFGITDAMSLVLGAGVGYTDDYWSAAATNILVAGNRSSGWNHYYVTASLPIALNCRATLTPYVSYTGAPDTWVVDGINAGTGLGAQSDILSGGVSLSVSF